MRRTVTGCPDAPAGEGDAARYLADTHPVVDGLADGLVTDLSASGPTTATARLLQATASYRTVNA